MINSIEIKSFKKIPENGLLLNGLTKVNYLVGENGCGKSSVLEAVKLFSDTNILDIRGTTHAYFQSLGDYTKIFNKNTSVCLTYDSQDVNIKRKTKFDLSELSETTAKFLYTHESLENEEQSRNINAVYDCIYVSFFKLTSDTSNLIFKPLDQSFDDISNSTRSDVIDFLNRFYFTAENNVTHLYKSLDSNPCIQIELKHGEIYNLKAFSGGFKSLLTLYIHLKEQIRWASSNKNKAYLICIEEPEVSFHPKFQKLIPQILNDFIESERSFSVQFLITTHSPFIISSAIKQENQKVYLIKDGVVCDRSLEPSTKGVGYSHDGILPIVAKMLGAGIEDLNSETIIKEKFNIIYCEGENKLTKDSDLYSIIFPTDREKNKNIFISCGGANAVQRTFYSAQPTYKFMFGKNSKLFALFDCSNSQGLAVGPYEEIKTTKEQPRFTDKEREKFLSYQNNFRMLKRKEIENYIYDPKVLKKAYPNLDLKEQIKAIDFINGEVKDIIGEIKHNNKLDMKTLAKAIYEIGEEDSNDPLYKELYDSIFN